MSGYVQVFIDGAARHQGSARPNEAAAACVVYHNKKEVASFAQGLGDVSNNVAEYQALISALLICSMAGLPTPIIYSDSLVIVNHIKGVWKCQSHDLFPFYMTVKEIQEDFAFTLVHVPRSKVFMADNLCNIFLDELALRRSRIPVRPPKPTNEELTEKTQGS